MLVLDHIAVLGETLTGAVAHAETCLGLPLLAGGKHSHFATHNRLLGLEDGLYFEAIAADPEAPALPYPRWFGLDRFRGEARLDKWILRVDDIGRAQALLPEAGEPVRLSRGALSWTMLVPPDGLLPFDGMFPAIIQWHSNPPPGDSLPSSGLRLTSLEVSLSEAETLSERLGPHLKDSRISFVNAEKTGIRAEFEGPLGTRRLV